MVLLHVIARQTTRSQRLAGVSTIAGLARRRPLRKTRSRSYLQMGCEHVVDKISHLASESSGETWGDRARADRCLVFCRHVDRSMSRVETSHGRGTPLQPAPRDAVLPMPLQTAVCAPRSLPQLCDRKTLAFAALAATFLGFSLLAGVRSSSVGTENRVRVERFVSSPATLAMSCVVFCSAFRFLSKLRNISVTSSSPSSKRLISTSDSSYSSDSP